MIAIPKVEDTLLVRWIRNMSASRWPGRFVAKTVVPTSVIVRDEASANADPDDSSGIVPKGDGRIVVMLTCQYNEILGGAEKQCAALTAGLRSAGTNVEVVTSRVPGFDVPEHEPGVRRFWTYSPPQLAGRHLPAGIVWAVQVFVWIAINRRRIAILHCHQLRINAYVAALAHAAFGIPTVMKLGVGGERNDFTIINQRKYLFGRRGTRFVIRNSTKVIAIASQIRADCLAWGVPEARIESVVNGVDLSRAAAVTIGAADPRIAAYDELRRVVFVGRPSPEKNAGAIVGAAAALGAGPKMQLDLLGDGPLTERIDLLRRDSTHVEIVPNGRVDDVFVHLQHMHFIVLVSWSEGLSNALLEAVSSGVVPILSDASGNRDVIPFPDYPFFVRDPSVAEIARVLDAARQMAVEDWRALSEQLAVAARAQFDSRHVCRSYIDIYRGIAKQ